MSESRFSKSGSIQAPVETPTGEHLVKVTNPDRVYFPPSAASPTGAT